MFKIVTDHQIITRDNRQQKSNYILSMIRGYFGCIFHVYTYVVGYSFITVVHILQFSITRYNIYNRQREKLEERGTLRWSILLIFPLHIVFDIPRKYFYFPCFKLFMGDGNYDCRLCTHYFNVFTVWSNRISLVGV